MLLSIFLLQSACSTDLLHIPTNFPKNFPKANWRPKIRMVSQSMSEKFSDDNFPSSTASQLPSSVGTINDNNLDFANELNQEDESNSKATELRLENEKPSEVSIEIQKFDEEENKKEKPLLESLVMAHPERSGKTRKKPLTKLIKGLRTLGRFAFLFWDFIFFVCVLAHYHRYHLFSFHNRHRYPDLQYAVSYSFLGVFTSIVSWCLYCAYKFAPPQECAFPCLLWGTKLTNFIFFAIALVMIVKFEISGVLGEFQ